MIKEKAFAKLNLNLHVIMDSEYKKKTGYFPVSFINCELKLHDELFLSNQYKKIEILCKKKELQTKSNLIYKAALLIKKTINDQSLGVKITLIKNIPVKAGLGGGSADAAATIRGLQKLWNIKLTKKQIINILMQLGTDVFYCYKKGVCKVEDNGSKLNCLFANYEKKCMLKKTICQKAFDMNEKVCSASKMPTIWLIIISPKEKKKSTAFMYEKLEKRYTGKNLDQILLMKKEILNNNKSNIVKYLYNDFSDIVYTNFPETAIIKAKLLKEGAEGIIIAGSGLSVVGFFVDKDRSLKAFNTLKINYPDAIWTQTK